MRPISKSQSFLVCPFSRILGGGEASVRLIRILCIHPSRPFLVSELSQNSGVTLNGVKRVLKELEETGLIERTGPRLKGYQLREEFPLTKSLISLFTAEQDFSRNLRIAIQGIFDSIKFPGSIWLDKACLEPNFCPRDAIIIYALSGSPDLMPLIQKSLDDISRIENAFDISFLVKALSPADIEALEKEDLERLISSELLFGVPPPALRRRDRKADLRNKSQKDLTEASLALSLLAAQKVEQNPMLIKEALEKIDSQLSKASESTQNELKKWQRLLRSGSVKRILSVLTGTGEQAMRMRQSSPFSLLLSSAEKENIFGKTSEKK